jgi:hypothetical protein
MFSTRGHIDERLSTRRKQSEKSITEVGSLGTTKQSSMAQSQFLPPELPLNQRTEDKNRQAYPSGAKNGQRQQDQESAGSRVVQNKLPDGEHISRKMIHPKLVVGSNDCLDADILEDLNFTVDIIGRRIVINNS